jgi:hypothetical protein
LGLMMENLPAGATRSSLWEILGWIYHIYFRIIFILSFVN